MAGSLFNLGELKAGWPAAVGKMGWASAARFRTNSMTTCRSSPGSRWAMILLTPNRLWYSMWRTPGVPANCCSSGAVTVSSTISAEASGYRLSRWAVRVPVRHVAGVVPEGSANPGADTCETTKHKDDRKGQDGPANSPVGAALSWGVARFLRLHGESPAVLASMSLVVHSGG